MLFIHIQKTLGNPDRNTGNDVHSRVHTSNETRDLGTQTSHLSVQTELSVSSNLHYCVQKQARLLRMNKCIVFLYLLFTLIFTVSGF
jgi:hypothetical protein